MKKIIYILIILTLVIVCYSSNNSEIREPDYQIKKDKLIVNIYFSKKYLSSLILTISFDNTIRFKDELIQKYFLQNFNIIDIKHFISKNNLEKKIKEACETYKKVKNPNALYMILTGIGNNVIDKFVYEYENKIEQLYNYIKNYYIDNYLTYFQYILNKYFKLIEMEGLIKFSFFYPIYYLPTYCNIEQNEDEYINWKIFKGSQEIFMNSLNSYIYQNFGFCRNYGQDIYVMGQDKYNFVLISMHELCHSFQFFNNYCDKLHEIYLNDSEMDSILKNLISIIPDLKDYVNSDNNIDWFNYLWNSKKTSHHVENSNTIVYIEFNEAMCKIIEQIIIINENIDLDSILSRKARHEFGFFYNFVFYYLEKNIIKTVYSKEENLIFWYNIFKEYLKYIVKVGSIS